MKKLHLLLVGLFAANSVYAQGDSLRSDRKNELKLNLVSAVTGAFEGTYERNLNRKSSLGISVFTYFSKNRESNDDINSYVSTYYRRYFGKKFASGFFVEGFGMLSSIDSEKIYDVNDNSKFTRGADVIDFSFGLGIGSKWVTKSGIIFEVNAGIGKQLFNADKTDFDLFTRFGFHVGYKF